MTSTVTTINPYTEQPITEYQLLDKEAAQQAVDNADKCFQSWKLTSIGQRAEYALKLAQVLESHQQQLALDAGITEMLRKPVNPNELIEKLTAIVMRGR